MNGFKDMLKYFRLREGLTQGELGTAIGCGKSCISMYEKGLRRPSPDVLEAIADYFNVNIDTLLGRTTPGMVPLIGRIACGAPILAEQNIEEYISLPSGVKADYALTCRGESMIGAGIHDGDTVFIRADAEVRNGQIAAVLIGEEATLKHVLRTASGVTLGADNPAVDSIELVGPEAEGARIMGLAVAYLHKLV